jgi:hypothetical protein
LFFRTLQTFFPQRFPSDEYEILVIDDGGTDPELVPMLKTVRAHGLPVRYFRVDVRNVSGLSQPIFQYKGMNDPGPAMNVGIRHARFDRVVISSPEVAHAVKTNLDRLSAWPLEESDALIADVFDPNFIYDVQLRGMIGGGPGRRPLHFLGMYYRQRLIDMGGFEEEFLCGWGFQDSEFVHRFQKKWGGTFQFTGPAVRAFHQPHDRLELETQAGVPAGEALFTKLVLDPAYRVANVGRIWGSDEIVVDTRWTED